MTPVARPVSTIGDAAILLVRDALLEFDATPPLLTGSGRILRSTTALGTFDANNARAMGCMFRIVTIVEAYSDAALESLFRGVLPSSSPAALRLLDSHMLDATQRWETRKRSFAEHHSVLLADKTAGFPQWSKLDGMIQVRNAMAHGLGTLTRQQRKNPFKAAAQCAQIGVRIHAGELIVDRPSLGEAAKVGESFVRWLDAKFP